MSEHFFITPKCQVLPLEEIDYVETFELDSAGLSKLVSADWYFSSGQVTYHSSKVCLPDSSRFLMDLVKGQPEAILAEFSIPVVQPPSFRCLIVKWLLEAVLRIRIW